jgi:putative FmdB family regulatory protein
MPIYGYRCQACGEEHDVLQKVSEPPLTKCPACGKKALKKQLSAAGFQLKGSGWYATDFKSKKPAEKKPEAKSEAKTEAKTETKTETKPDAKPASTTTTGD